VGSPLLRAVMSLHVLYFLTLQPTVCNFYILTVRRVHCVNMSYCHFRDVICLIMYFYLFFNNRLNLKIVPVLIYIFLFKLCCFHTLRHLINFYSSPLFARTPWRCHLVVNLKFMLKTSQPFTPAAENIFRTPGPRK
jgi:hypothetical protein